MENYFRDRIELTTAKETKTNTMSRADYDNILCTITSKWEHALDMSTQNLHESKVREVSNSFINAVLLSFYANDFVF